MTLKIYGLGVSILALLVGCSGKTVAPPQDNGDGGTAEDGGPTIDSGTVIIPADSGVGEETSTTTPDTGPPDSGLNHGTVSTTYPAFSPFMPAVLNNGYPALSAPQIVTVTWSNVDSNYATWEAFDDNIGSSAYWTTTTSEYGVGAAVGGGHVELTDPFTITSDSDVASFVAANVGVAPWPAADPGGNSIFTMYLPPGQSITLQGLGDACSNGVGGYHDNVTVGETYVAYAVVLQCGGGGGGGGAFETTGSASHELIEASTDPQPPNGYTGLNDNQFLAWDIFQQEQDEIADMCELYPDAFYENSALGAAVQRTWSNMSAAAGNAPCVPIIENGAYYNVTPLDQETVSLDLSAIGGPSNFTTQGYTIAVGATKTFAVGFYSSAATSGPWNIVAHAGNPIAGGTANVTVSVDVPSGQNGNMAYVTVTVNAQDSSGTDSNLITIESTVAGDQDCGGFGCSSRWMPILISSQM